MCAVAAARILPAVRGASRFVCVAIFGLGAVAGCFREDFMLDAVCGNDAQCGENQCCSGNRCRPSPEGCDRGAGIDTSYNEAYRSCRDDDECIDFGMPHCVRLDGVEDGFCADLCQGVGENCEEHPESSSLTCLELDGQRHCALQCCNAGCDPDTGKSLCPGQTDCPDACPGHLECLADVCVRKAQPS